MIHISRFLQDHLDYLLRFKEVEDELQARKDDLYRSTDSLISHPETGKAFKSYLLEFRRNL